jgi:hypothetical protein
VCGGDSGGESERDSERDSERERERDSDSDNDSDSDSDNDNDSDSDSSIWGSSPAPLRRAGLCLVAHLSRRRRGAPRWLERASRAAVTKAAPGGA